MAAARRAVVAAALAFCAGAYDYDRLPPRRCGLQNVAHDPAAGTRVAIALFGLFRHNCTLANFERFLLEPLLHHRPEPYTVDVVMHANVVERITNARTNEVDAAPPRHLDWTGFAPCRYTLEDQDVLDVKLGRLRRRVMATAAWSSRGDGDQVRGRGAPFYPRRARGPR